jgi:hypothetical protein
MIWLKTSPLGKQLMQISEVIRQSANALRDSTNHYRVAQSQPDSQASSSLGL